MENIRCVREINLKRKHVAYRFEKHENIEGEVKRIAREILDELIRAIDEDEDRAEVIHKCRTTCKKMRGLLRLVRDGMGKSYGPENGWYRDIADTLGPMRDAWMSVVILEGVIGKDKKGKFAAVKEAVKKRRNIEVPAEKIEEEISTVRKKFAESYARVAAMKIIGVDFYNLGLGMKRTYKRAQKAMAAAIKTNTEMEFHEWRKRTKYHHYHCELLRETGEEMGERPDEVKKLSDLLGFEHDLTILRPVIAETCGETAVELFSLIDEKQKEYRRTAIETGAKVFEMETEEMVKWAEEKWNEWKG